MWVSRVIPRALSTAKIVGAGHKNSLLRLSPLLNKHLSTFSNQIQSVVLDHESPKKATIQAPLSQHVGPMRNAALPPPLPSTLTSVYTKTCSKTSGGGDNIAKSSSKTTVDAKLLLDRILKGSDSDGKSTKDSDFGETKVAAKATEKLCSKRTKRFKKSRETGKKKKLEKITKEFEKITEDKVSSKCTDEVKEQDHLSSDDQVEEVPKLESKESETTQDEVPKKVRDEEQTERDLSLVFCNLMFLNLTAFSYIIYSLY